jgi:hypothetical protein
VLEAAAMRVDDVDALVARATERLTMAERFVDAYRRYCWPVDGLEGIALAPFQVLAGEGAVHALAPHPWHMGIGARLAAADPDTFRATASVAIDLDDPVSEGAAVAWWEDLTAVGGEGMVVKPLDVVARRGNRLAQPGINVGAGSTCASSTAPSTRHRTSSTGCVTAASAISARSRSASSPSVSKRSSVSSPRSRCTECTNASSEFSH